MAKKKKGKSPRPRKGEARKQQTPKKIQKEPVLNSWQRQLVTHGAIVLGFLIILIGYFKPIVIDGKIIQQHDIVQFQGMAKETQDFRKATGEEALWVSTLFSGMPAFQTSVKFPSNLFNYVDKFFTFGLPRPVNYLFLTFVGFYFLLLTLRINPYVSAIGALAFSLSSYFFIIQSAGHTSKANAIAYMAPLLAGIFMAYRGRILLGSVITAFFLALEINANHYQMTYYLAMAILLLGIFFGVDAIRNKTLPDFLKTSAALIIAALLGVAPNAGRLITTYQYASETMRGSSELQEQRQEGEAQNGLNMEYAFRWSYGIAETFTLLIPNFHGGASVGDVGENETYKLLRQTTGNASQAKSFVKNWYTYWGPQAGGTSGPVYVGAIVCFLFVLGLMLVKGKMKWWLLAITIMSIVLAWGGNFPAINEFFFKYFPAYNKFRAPSMMLVIAELSMPLLGVLALHQIIQKRDELEWETLKKQLLIALGATAGLALLLALIGPSLMDFTNPAIDGRRFQQLLGSQANATQVNQFIDAAIADRIILFRNDALRSAVFILLAAGLIWFYAQNKIKLSLTMAGLAALMLFDMLPVNQRYLNDKNYTTENRYKANFNPTQADQAILQDKDPNYRVLNLSTDTFNDAKTSYFHKHIGGYHAAKLRRYQDIISNHMDPEIRKFGSLLNSRPADSVFRAMMGQLPVINMLNTRYIIVNPEAQPVRNPAAMGNAWFVEEIEMVDNADAEIKALEGFDPQRKAVIDKRFEAKLNGFTPGEDSTATIRYIDTSYKPNHLTYETNSQRDMLAVFSEVYYNDGKGWNAYIDGEKVAHVRANYILRALVVPAGEHKVEFKFEPSAYALGETISLIFSILLLAGLGGVLFLTFRKRK